MSTHQPGNEPQETARPTRIHEYVDPATNETKSIVIEQEYDASKGIWIWPMVRVTNGQVTIGPHARYL